MTSNSIGLLNENSVRRVLHVWDSLKRLGASPLACLRIVEAHRQDRGYSQDGAGRGLAFQEVLRSAIETLRPQEGLPNPHERCWRPYIILTDQFIRGRSPEAVRAQLYISKGTYYGEQKRALEMLSSVLLKQEVELSLPVEQPNARGKPPALFTVPPHPAHGLIGRERCLQELKASLLDGSRRTDTALNGLPGVGKTALVLELAYDPEIRAHFSGGIFWSGLGRQPDLLALLGNWAEALSIPPAAVAAQASLANRAALVHASIGMARCLLIIDDAWQLEYALALKVGGPNSVHLLTTRFPDIALGFTSGHVTTVHELSPEEGLHLLEELAPCAVSAGREQAQKLVQAVGSLPLALILMGRYLQKQGYGSQTRRVQQALQELHSAGIRLRLSQLRSPLESDPNLPFNTPVSLQAVIGLSTAALDPNTQQALSDLSLLPPKPSTFSEQAALAITDTSTVVLDRLVDCGLVESFPPDRYALHQTIADYAALQAASPAAGERLVDYFTGFARAHVQDHALLDQEITNLFTACDLALQQQNHSQLIALVLALYPFLETRGLYALTGRYLQNACAAADQFGDPLLQAAALNKLGDFAVRRARFKEAQIFLKKSLALARDTGSREIAGEVLFNLGLACAYRGDILTGRDYLEQGLQIQSALGDGRAESYALNALGFTLQELSRYAEASAILEEALQKSIANGERRNEGWVHFNLCQVRFSLGEYARALEHAQQCARIYHQLGDSRGEGWIVFEQGRVYRQMGEYEKAAAAFSGARKALSELGDTMGEAYSISNQGLICMDWGENAAAEANFKEALKGFRGIECQVGECQTYHFLATLYRRLGDYSQAKSLLEESIAIFRCIPYLRGECTHLANLALAELGLGNRDLALERAHLAVRIAGEIQALPTRVYVQTCLGQVLLGCSQPEAAEQAFTRALAIASSLGRLPMALEPLAGLAEIASLRGDPYQARLLVDEMRSICAHISVPNGCHAGYIPRLDRPPQPLLERLEDLKPQV